jgi:hypothetical protein
VSVCVCVCVCLQQCAPSLPCIILQHLAHMLVYIVSAVCRCCLPPAAAAVRRSSTPALYLLGSPRSIKAHCTRGFCRVSQHSLVKRGAPTLAPLHRHTAAPVQLCASRGLRHACFRTAQLLCGSPVQAAVLTGCLRRGMELRVIPAGVMLEALPHKC